MKYWPVILAFLMPYMSNAQHDTYIVRDHTTGKSVKPAVPARKPVALLPSPITPRGVEESTTTGASDLAPLLIWASERVKYPARALRAGVEGMVYLSLQVNPDGHVEDVVFKQLVASDNGVVHGPALPADLAVAEMIQEAERVFRFARYEPAATGSVETVRLSFFIR